MWPKVIVTVDHVSTAPAQMLSMPVCDTVATGGMIPAMPQDCAASCGQGRTPWTTTRDSVPDWRSTRHSAASPGDARMAFRNSTQVPTGAPATSRTLSHCRRPARSAGPSGTTSPRTVTLLMRRPSVCGKSMSSAPRSQFRMGTFKGGASAPSCRPLKAKWISPVSPMRSSSALRTAIADGVARPSTASTRDGSVRRPPWPGRGRSAR